MNMKKFVILATFFAFSATKNQVSGLEIKLEKGHADKFLTKFEEKLKSGDVTEIVADCNVYTDKLLVNIGKFAISHGLDPVLLSNVKEEFLGSSINLTQGHLDGISTVSRARDVELIYQHATKKLTLKVPILFTDLSFNYHYHIILLIMGPEGGVTGEIVNFTMDIVVEFDFNTYHAKIDTLKTSDTGSVTLKFDGNALVDWIVNIFTQFVGAILHPLIVGIIEGIVKNVANVLVGDVNKLLDAILHPNSTAVAEIIRNNFIIV